MMSLTKIEQETIILFNEGEADAEVYTHNAKLKKKLETAAKKNPTLYRLKDKNAHGGVSYTFPKKYLTVIFRDEISEADQSVLAQRLAKARAVQNPEAVKANLRNSRKGKANTQGNE